jgi:hypothetical protein
MQTPDAPAVGDRVVIEAPAKQLRERDHPVLPGRRSGDQNVGCGEFMGIIAIN